MDIIKANRPFRSLICLLAAALVLTAGCAARKTAVPSEQPMPSVVVPRAEGRSIELVSILRKGDAVLIEADGAIRYTAFRLSDPPRVILDLPAVSVENVESPIEVDNDFITRIVLTSYGEGEERIGRIEIGLKQGVVADIKAGEDSILVEFRKQDLVSGADGKDDGVEAEEAAVRSAAAEQQAAAGGDEAVRGEEEEFGPDAGEVLSEAANIIDVEISGEGDVSVVRITADGLIGDYNAFGLGDPPRVVLDVLNVGTLVHEKSMDADVPAVKRVRMGAHPDKTRFVFDSSLQTVPYYSVTREGASLVVRFSPIESAVAAVGEEGEEVVEGPSEVEVGEPVFEGEAGGVTEAGASGEPAGEEALAEELAPAESVSTVPAEEAEAEEVVEELSEAVAEVAVAEGEPGEVTEASVSEELVSEESAAEELASAMAVSEEPSEGVAEEVVEEPSEAVAEVAVAEGEAGGVTEAGASGEPAGEEALAEELAPAESVSTVPAEEAEAEEVVEEPSEAVAEVVVAEGEAGGVTEAGASGEPAGEEALAEELASAMVVSEVTAEEVVAGNEPGDVTDAGISEVSAGEEARAEKFVSATVVSGASVEEAVEGPSDAVAEGPRVEGPAVEEKKYIDIEDISFKRLADKARLSIASSAKPKYRLKESRDGKVLTLDLIGSLIPDELQRTLDASELDTPVVTISSYQAYTEPVGDVRVIVRLRDSVPYEVAEEGNTINIDFPPAVDEAEEVAAVEDVGKSEVEPAWVDEEEAQAGQDALPERKYTGRRISIDMVDAQITDVLKLLAEVSDLNIIASEEVTGTITLRLKDVPWDQAFDLILKTKGLDKIHEGNVVRVAPVQRIREEREAALAAKKAAEKLEELRTEYIRINYDKAATLAEQIQNVLTNRGTVTVHEPTNTLIIKDISSAIEEAKAYIEKVDIPIPQVLIEARIVEAESTFARDLGIQWGIDYRTKGNKVHTSTFGSVREEYGQWAPQPNQQSGTLEGGGTYPVEKKSFLADVGVTNYAVNLPATGNAGTLGALGFILGKTGANPMLLDLRISAGEQEGLVKTISRPRIVTMDNKAAKIEQGESIPYQTTSASGTQTTFVNASLSLEVTPHITPDGSVLMKIKATRNSVGTVPTGATAPSIYTKEASTEVIVKDGETTVMGGIIISDTKNSSGGIPFLKDVPVLGWLFKNKSVSDSQKELLIFITPTIIQGKNTG